MIAQLDVRYRDRNAKEKALGRDVKALERLLAQLRAAAARAAKEREAAAARANRAVPWRLSVNVSRRRPPPGNRSLPFRIGGV